MTTWRRTLAMITPAARRRWWLLLPVVLLAAVLEAGAAAGIFVFILLLTGSAPAPGVAAAMRAIGLDTPQSVLVGGAAILGAYYLVRSAVVLWAQYVKIRVCFEASEGLACALLRRYFAAPYPFHLTRNSADLIRNCTSSVQEVVGQVLASVVALASELLLAVAVVVVLVRTSPGVALASALLVLVVTAVVGHATRTAAIRHGARSHALDATILRSLQHALGAVKELKVLAREETFYQEFAGLQREFGRLGNVWLAVTTMPPVVLQTVLVCGGLFTAGLLVWLGHAPADVLAVAGVFGYATLRLIPAAQNTITTINIIRSHGPAVDELYRDMITLSDPHPRVAAGPPIAFADAIELDRVSFRYSADAPLALEDVSLTIRRGESLAILGPSGAGKSTLADVILGLLTPTAGAMRVDGQPVSGEGSVWHRRAGYVPQSAFLIDDTIRRNIALGIPDAEIDEQRIREVVAIARLDKVIDRLPDGLDGRAGERGVRLSGGERQRVAIARALYHDPELLVFDEATSSLDLETEADVARTIEALRGTRTIIVIAHRLSAVRHCTAFVWLDAGRVAERGLPATLAVT